MSLHPSSIVALLSSVLSISTAIARADHPTCPPEVQLVVADTAPTARLVLDATVSGSYAIVAFDARNPSAFPPRVVRVGWHDGAQATNIDLERPLPTNIALRAWLTPAGRAAASALVSALAPSNAPAGAAALLVYPMRVRFSPLDCSSGSSTSGQIACSVVNTHQNEDVSFRFTLPVDPTSVFASTFQIVDTVTGASPLGSYIVDPNDDRTLIFRPALTFDAVGNPIFGFASGGTYQIRLPGFAQGDAPPYLMSTTALPNQNRVLHAITTDQGLLDYVPGSPNVTFKVDVVTGYNSMGVPNMFAQDVPANGATNVWVDSNLTLEFDDVMNVGTLVVPALGAMPFITVKIDADGDLSTTADQVAQTCSVTVFVSVDSHSTRLVLDPSPSWPHSGSGSSPQLVVVNVPSQVHDIVGNAVANAGTISFQTEP